MLGGMTLADVDPAPGPSSLAAEAVVSPAAVWDVVFGNVTGTTETELDSEPSRLDSIELVS